MKTSTIILLAISSSLFCMDQQIEKLVDSSQEIPNNQIILLHSNDGATTSLTGAEIRASQVLEMFTQRDCLSQRKWHITLHNFESESLYRAAQSLRYKAAKIDREKEKHILHFYKRHKMLPSAQKLNWIKDYLNLDLNSETSYANPFEVVPIIHEHSKGNLTKVEREIKKWPQDLQPYLAKYYYLLFGKEREFPLPYLNYRFSILELWKHGKIPPTAETILYKARLDLSWMKIKNLVGLSCIKGIEAVEALFLDHNNIQHLPLYCFDRLKKLQKLNLNHNSIKEIPQYSDTLKKLKYLRLNNNQISKIPYSCFKKLSKLRRLYLNHNNIKNLPTDFMYGLHQLLGLYLHNNKFNAVPRLLPTYLDPFYGNPSNPSRFEVKFLSSLSVLTLHNNPIVREMWHNRFQNLPHLKFLSMPKCTIKIAAFKGFHREEQLFKSLDRLYIGNHIFGKSEIKAKKKMLKQHPSGSFFYLHREPDIDSETSSSISSSYSFTDSSDS